MYADEIKEVFTYFSINRNIAAKNLLPICLKVYEISQKKLILIWIIYYQSATQKLHWLRLNMLYSHFMYSTYK